MFHHHHHCDRDNDSSGVLAISFAIVCFAIAIVAFSVALVAAHLFCLSTGLLRLMEGKWLRAGFWFAVLALLVWVDFQVWS
jgi:hypothetical protein